MSDSKIEWCDKTWNPVTGCTKISEGCRNCYAERQAKRFGKQWGLPANNPFAVTKRRDEIFLDPIRWRNPARIFCCSMGDLFHDDVPDNWIAAVLAVMAMTYDHTGKMRDAGDGLSVAICKQRHTYILLTKRPERMQRFFTEFLSGDIFSKEPNITRFAGQFCKQLARNLGQEWWMNADFSLASWIDNGLPGLWIGVTAENQEQADKRIPILLQTPAAVRFVSVEPMLGPVNLRNIRLKDGGTLDALKGIDTTMQCHYAGKLDWVICGGESGPGARPMHPDWARSLRDQCQAAGTPFLFKQWGEWQDGSAYDTNAKHLVVTIDGKTYSWPNAEYTSTKDWPYLHPRIMAKVGKKEAGRLLDGQLWDVYPTFNRF
jgi:protein gp37